MRNFLKKHIPLRLLIHLLAWKYFFFGEPEMRLLKELVDPKKGALDIGANRGYFSYFLSRLCPWVRAYEPNPAMRAFLERTVRKNTTISPLALSDASGKAELRIPVLADGEHDGWASLAKTYDDMEVRTLNVALGRLDDEPLSNVGFIKIDVEGHEEEVIRGGRELLLRERPTLLVEIEQRHLQKGIDAVFQTITELGYEGFFLLDGRLTPLTSFSLEQHQMRYLKNGEVVGKGYLNNFIFKAL